MLFCKLIVLYKVKEMCITKNGWSSIFFSGPDKNELLFYG